MVLELAQFLVAQSQMPEFLNQLILAFLACQLPNHQLVCEKLGSRAQDALIGFVVKMLRESIANVAAFSEINPLSVVEQCINS